MSLIFTPVMAQEHDLVETTPTPEDAESMAGFFHYSPCAGHGFPNQVYWGDTDLHTNNSPDARCCGNFWT